MRAQRMAWLGIALVCAAPFLFLPTLRVPILRSSGLVLWIALAAGLASAFAALRARRSLLTRVALAFCALVGGATLYGFVVWQRLPPASAPLVSTQAPEVNLLDERGDAFALRERWANGPLLLVFYRGSW